MAEKSILLFDETSEKYFRFSTKWITGLFIKNILLQLKNIKPSTILDIGCGTGYISNKINQSLDANIICCDTDVNRLKFAKQHFQLETILADVTSLPFKTATIDTVIAIEIIEHVSDINSALTETTRVSKNNVIFTVPNDPFFMIANFLRGKNLKSFGNPPDHINHFNKRSFKIFLSEYYPNVEISLNALLWLIAKVKK